MPATLDYMPYALEHETGQIAVRSWSASAGGRPTLLCAHGINQNSRHFAPLAERLASDFEVIVPDYPGRGLSAPLQDMTAYTQINYAKIMQALLAAKGLQSLDWLGTSMGGLTGLHLAALPDSPIRKLILNDVGPLIPGNTRVQFVVAAKSPGVRFASPAEALQRMERVFANFGIRDPALKETFVAASLRQDADGGWRPDFDPAIYDYARTLDPGNLPDVPFWAQWEKVRCPVLVLHGVNSTTLTPAIIAEMQRTRPDITVVDIPDTGHAPHLMDAAQAELIRDWLLN